MPKTVSLADIADALDMPGAMAQVYLDRETGEISHLPDECMSAAEDEEDDLDEHPDWERELIEMARTIVADTEGRYVQLPDQYEIDEYRFLASFADSYPDPVISDRLGDAIQGRGAFRRFKDLVHHLGIADQWYEYRSQRLLEAARAWCEAEKIPYEEGPRRATAAGDEVGS